MLCHACNHSSIGLIFHDRAELHDDDLCRVGDGKSVEKRRDFFGLL